MYGIGTAADDIHIIEPGPEVKERLNVVRVFTGGSITHGKLVQVWKWGLLPKSEFDILWSYLQSGQQLYVQTRVLGGDFEVRACHIRPTTDYPEIRVNPRWWEPMLIDFSLEVVLL